MSAVMKVIQVELEDWQAEVFAAMARRRDATASAIIRGFLDAEATRHVNSACERLIDSLSTAQIEYRLAHLFHR